MSTPENDPLWFLSLDSLAKIVFDKKLWRLFENYLTTKRLVRAKLEEIAPIRNRIARYRALHKDDLLRVVAVLRDIDEGFWKFCTSYNNAIWFAPPFTRDPIFKHFAARQHLGATRVSPGGYAVVGILMGVDVNVELRFSARPRARRRVSKIIGQRGYLYDFTFSTTYHHDDSGILDYPRILNATRQYHETVIHITSLVNPEIAFFKDLEKRLKGKFPSSPLYRNSGEAFLPARCLSAGCAKWVLKNCLTFTDAFFCDWA